MKGGSTSMSYDRVQVRNNSFSRVTANEMKMGAYYTDIAHCKVIGQLFKFPSEEVCVLEPSIGDGSAVKACTRPEVNEGVKIFGVELNDEVAKKTREDQYIESCLSADFTNGATISNNVFSFCFGNPPYMDGEDEVGRQERMEAVFLNHVTSRYLRNGGILVWIIPYRIFSDPVYFKFLMTHYEKLAVYKFWPEEYAKWHQVVFIGRKIPTRVQLATELVAEREKYANEALVPELPQTFEGTELFESIEVITSKSEAIRYFAPKVFDPVQAFSFLASGRADLEDYSSRISQKCTQKEYTSTDMGRPPIPPKKDSMYLMITSGAGQGLAGEVGKDAHLQRGVAEIVEESVYETDPHNPEMEIEVVKSRTKVSMTTLETSGKITVLE